MKLYLSLPFLAFLLAGGTFGSTTSSWRRTSSPSFPHPDAERFTASAGLERDLNGRKIVIKLDQDLDQAFDNIELLQEMHKDIQLIKEMLVELRLDMKELRGLDGLTAENVIDGSSNSNADRLYSSFPSPSSSSSWSSGWRNTRSNFSSGRRQLETPYTPKWGVSLTKLNCAELRLSGIKKSGVYSIQPDKNSPAFEVRR